MKNVTAVCSLLLALSLASGCGSSKSAVNPDPLDSKNVNLVFTVSEDLAYQAPGDINPNTANLTNQGLQRSLQMATFLRQSVLGNENVNGIYALQPMSHLQTSSNFPDIVAIESIQQFAMINQVTISSSAQGWVPVSAYGYPLNVGYAAGATVPSGVASPLLPCSACQGIDFNNAGKANDSLLSGIVTANLRGFYVFSTPWETTSALLAIVNQATGSNFALPASYQGPNYIYAISIAPSGKASLVTYNSNLTPAAAYPALPSPVATNNACTAQTPFNISVTQGVNGAMIPSGANTNETLYMIRHAEAHPAGFWDDGTYVGAGQWRSLALPNALHGKIAPDQVWSSDPAQVLLGTQTIAGRSYWSYVRPSLTVEPYAIANQLPYFLVAGLEIFGPNSPRASSNFFFTGGTFSNHKTLVSWEHNELAAAVNALIASYFPNGGAPNTITWPSADYDSVWTVKFDSVGNFTLDNATCEGIDSATLPAVPPQF